MRNSESRQKSFSANAHGFRRCMKEFFLCASGKICVHIRLVCTQDNFPKQIGMGNRKKISFVIAELQKAFNLPPGKIFKVCMNLPQNVVKLGFPN